MRTRVHQRHLLLAVAVLTVATACGDGSTATPAPPPRSTPSSSAPPSAPPPSPGTGLQTQDPSGPYDLVLTGVRASERAGGTRLVLTFDGSGMPGWAARYVRRAVLEGSGEVAPLDGEAILRFDVSGTPTLPERDDPVATKTGGDVVDLLAIGAWEGYSQVFVGLAGDRLPFRISTRTDPARMIVDLG